MKQMSHSCGQETELTSKETGHHHEEDKMRVLYEASHIGCVSTLNSLLHEDPGILHKISSQIIYIETPLHISASHGHFEFTKTLLSHKPELALERNCSQSTPLHLASAEGRTNIVKQLLEASKEASLVRDKEGRTPLHYAVIRGRREVVLELIKAKPESLKIIDDKGSTIFHTCVTYSQLEILKDLVKLNIHGTDDLLVQRDLDGKNTILHLAILLKQVETVSYLTSIPKIRSSGVLNLKNDMGYTAPDTAHRTPKDSKSLEIQVILMESGIKCGKRERIDIVSEEESCEKKWSCIHVLKSIDKWLMYKGDWVEEMRGNLSLVATVLATISFQAALNPPGSVIQQGIRPDDPNFNLTSSYNTDIFQGPLGCLPYKDGDSNRSFCPGEAMIAHLYPYAFGNFILYNTISFVASLCVALLLVSGVPLKHKFVMWMLAIGMGVALTCLLNAYFIGLRLIIPYSPDTYKTVLMATRIFMGLYALIIIYIAVKFVKWLVKILKANLKKPSKSSDPTADA